MKKIRIFKAADTGEHLHGKRSKRQVIKGQLFPLNQVGTFKILYNMKTFFEQFQWATSQPICYNFDASICRI